MRKCSTTLFVFLALFAALNGFAQNAPDPWIAYKAKDFAAALPGFQALAEKGDVKAWEQLGWIYKNGEGTPKDNAQSLAWFRKAAEQGSAPSQTELGWIYREGRGVDKDDAQAVSWFRKGAEQDYSGAQHAMGVSYASGRGIPKDDKEAIAWYEKAAQQGHARAKVALEERKNRKLESASDVPATPLSLAKEHKLGTTWEWSQFDARTKVEIAKSTRTVMDDNGRMVFFDGKTKSTTLLRKAANKPFRIWPLVVGETWEYGRSNWQQTAEVTAHESVEVPAGKYMAYKIVYTGYFTNSFGSHKQTETFWYAPDIAADVKYVIEEPDHKVFETRELIRYHVGTP